MLVTKRHDHPAGLERHSGVGDSVGDPVREIIDQVFGQPGIHFLVGKHGVPVRLVGDIVPSWVL